MTISTTEGGALVQGKGATMAEGMVEFVVFADCIGIEDGELFLRGETRTVPMKVYTTLRGAGRVCPDAAAEDAARADLEARLAADAPAKPAGKAKGEKPEA